MKRGGLYIKRAIFVALILIIFLMLFFYWDEYRKEKILIEGAKEWLEFLETDYMPSSMNFVKNNNTFSVQWNASETSFYLEINPDGNNVSYDLRGLIDSYTYLDEDSHYLLNETLAQEILGFFSSLQPAEFKCNKHQLPVGSGINCYTHHDSKTIEVFSFDGSLGIGTHISVSENVKE